MSPIAALAVLALAAAPAAAQKLEGEAAWKVTEPPGPALEASIDVREGTWMNVDVSPDGREILFDLLGDVYVLPFEGGEHLVPPGSPGWYAGP